MNFKLYEIEKQIENLIDFETGEVLNLEMFESLNLEYDRKIENLALSYKNLLAESQALKNEKNLLEDRQKKAEKKAECIKKFISEILVGQKKEFTKVSISYRKSKQVEVEEDFLNWAISTNSNLITYSDPKIDKIAIKQLLNDGENVPYSKIVEKTNIQIK